MSGWILAGVELPFLLFWMWGAFYSQKRAREALKICMDWERIWNEAAPIFQKAVASRVQKQQEIEVRQG